MAVSSTRQNIVCFFSGAEKLILKIPKKEVWFIFLRNILSIIMNFTLKLQS